MNIIFGFVLVALMIGLLGLIAEQIKIPAYDWRGWVAKLMVIALFSSAAIACGVTLRAMLPIPSF